MATATSTLHRSQKTGHQFYRQHSSLWIFLELRQRRIDEVPRLCVGHPHLHRWFETTGIVEAPGGHADPRHAWTLAAGEARTTLGTKAASMIVRPHHLAVGFEIAQLAARELEGGGRDINDGRMAATRDMLTIATVALEHLDLGWRSRAFVATRTADAATRKWSFNHKRSECCGLGVLPQRSSYSTNDRISTGQQNWKEIVQ